MLRSNLKFWWLAVVGIFFFAPVFSNPKERLHKKEALKWAVQKASSLRIQGSTNINTFGCDVVGYYQQDTIYCIGDDISAPVALQGALEIDISKFDCHNRMLTGDLRKTLKADQFPRLVIRFLSLERAPILRNSKDYLKGWVELELAGVCRRFEVCYWFIKPGYFSIELNGNRSFSFADFNLTPPNKLAGLVKVKDKFTVDFNLILNPVE